MINSNPDPESVKLSLYRSEIARLDEWFLELMEGIHQDFAEELKTCDHSECSKICADAKAAIEEANVAFVQNLYQLRIKYGF
jgi:hypothetical protein